MNSTALISRRALRTCGLAAVLAAASLVSACGDDDKNTAGPGPNPGGGGGGGSVPTADLGTAEAAVAQLGTVGQLIQALDALDGFTGTAVPAASMSAPAKADSGLDSDCAPGTRESFGPESRSVGSPYTSSAMSVSGERTIDCTYSGHSEASGFTTDVEIVLNGTAEGGSVDEASGTVFYARVGDDADAPYSFAYAINTSGSQGGQSFTSDIDIDLGVYYRIDGRQTSELEENQFRLEMTGDYAATANSGGQSGTATGSFTSYVGTSDVPFMVSSTLDGSAIEIDGEYGFSISPAPQGASCVDGSATIATVEPLARSTTANGSPYEAGTLELSSGDDSATVQFNGDGTVTVTGADGSTQTVDFADAVAAAAPCSGFAFTGLYLGLGAGAF